MNVMAEEAFKVLTNWPRADILKLMLGYSQRSRLNPDDVILVPYTYIPKECPRDIGAKNFKTLFVGEGRPRKYEFQPFGFVRTAIDTYLPYLKDLDFNGYVVAGSAPLLFTGLYRDSDDPEPTRKPSDIDIFLYGDVTSLESTYKRLLADLTKTIRNIAPEANFKVFRNVNCTTISVDGAGTSLMINKIQIIHRGYTTKQSVIVGFDLMPCQTFYDGQMIYYTLHAALAHYFAINPIDWRRESLSFVSRLEKYDNYGYTAICPYLDFDLVEEITKPKITGDNSTIIPIYYAGFIALELRNRYIECKVYNPKTEKDGTAYTNIPILNFSRQKEHGGDYYSTESDYAAFGVDENLGSGYLNMTLVNKDQEDLAYVISDDPAKILSEFTTTDFNTVLRDIRHEGTCDKYFADPNYYKYLSRSEELTAKRPLSEEELEEFCNLQRKMREILNERVKYLEDRLAPVYKSLKEIKFTTSNPGAQYSGTFNPIVRRSPQDFWGPRCSAYNSTIMYEEKYEFVLCINRCKSGKIFPYNLLYRDLIDLLLEYMDRVYMSDIVNGKDIRQANFTKTEKVNLQTIYPWATVDLLDAMK